MRALLLLAGAGQIALALSSLVLPRLLKWREQTSVLRPLTRQIFWTYAAYILGCNVAFGLASLFMADHLLDGTPLARAVAGFITLYWGARLVIQFGLYDRSDAPPGLRYKLAEAAIVLLFAYLTAVYGWTACPAKHQPEGAKHGAIR